MTSTNRTVLFSICALFCTAVQAQPLELERQALELPKDMREQLLNSKMSSNLSVAKFSLGRIKDTKFIVPEDIDPQEKLKVLGLIKQLKDLCPNCSTGGAIAGAPILGPNSVQTSSALFPTRSLDQSSDSKYIRILKSEYYSLVFKAAAFEQLNKK